jgi:hypothetical protein
MAITIDNTKAGNLTLEAPTSGAVTPPTALGNTGQFLTTNGSGVQAWSNTLTDATTTTQITSTLASGTAPFVIASNTAVANLNSSLLLGNTWATPAAIGTTTPAAGTFSAVTSTGNITFPKTSGFGIKVDTASPTYPWRDLIGNLRPDTGGANAPTLSASRGGRCREFFYTVADHDYVPGTDIYIHLHWAHNGTAISGSFVVEFSYTYAKGHQQAIFPAEKMVTVTVSTPNIATIPQYEHMISEVVMSSAGGSASLLDNALIEPDGIIQMNMTVATIPTITGGSVNEPYIMYADVHYQSTGIGTKQKAPNFYV